MGHLSDAKAEVRAVAAQMQLDWTAYPLQIELDNRESVDLGTQTKPFLQISVKPMAGEQMDMADNPLIEQRGQILLNVVSRAGDGTTESDALLEFAMKYFSLKYFTLVQCRAAVAVSPKLVKDRWYSPAIVDYWYQYLRN